MNGNIRIVIIGFGNVMEHICPCFKKLLGDAARTNLLAVTVDEQTLEAKRKKYPFEIQLGDNPGALRRMDPDIIIFAPPPEVARSIAETDLKPYYDELRSLEKKLPDFWCFPPSPKGDYYLDLFGQDVYVVHILPNMMNEIRGKILEGEGCNILTFPDGHPWPKEKYQRLAYTFSALGNVVSISPSHVMDALACRVTLHSISLILFDLQQELEKCGIKVDSGNIACCMRSFLWEISGWRPEVTDPCHRDAAPEQIHPFLKRLTGAIYKSVRKYGLETEIEVLAPGFCGRELDLMLHDFSIRDETEIRAVAQKLNTRGGVGEKGVRMVRLFALPLIEDAFYHASAENLPLWLADYLGKMYHCAIHEVRLHGIGLSRQTPVTKERYRHVFEEMTKAAEHAGN